MSNEQSAQPAEGRFSRIEGEQPTLIASGPDSVEERPAAKISSEEALTFVANPRAIEGGAVESMILGRADESVLKSLGVTIDRLPRVALREGLADRSEPIVRPKSVQMPEQSVNSRYRLDGEIARGGMGAILKGRDMDLGRDLAIKVLLDQHKDKPQVIQRFIEEAQIGGQLQHPGIAPVYELGKFADSRPFFSMKLIKGETLSKLLADRESLEIDRAKFIGIFEQVCQTMAYAHSRGVIHRDLKPANIMVGAFGEVQVMDWGLAKVLSAGGIADERKAQDKQQGHSVIQTMRSLGSDSSGAYGSVGSGSQTQMGSIMGTPAYMPPEQALGEIDHMDERADVFGLGAILCEILTGKPPYVAEDGTRVFRMASRGKLDECFQRLKECNADSDLVDITRHCLELEPADRPRDAAVLAASITQYIESVDTRLRNAEVTQAAETARAEQAIHTARFHEAAAKAERRARKSQMGLAAVVLAVTSLGGISAAWIATIQNRLKNEAWIAKQEADKAREEESQQRLRAESEWSRAEGAQRQAESEKIRSLSMLADMHTERGFQAGIEQRPAVAALWFANAAQLTPHDEDRQRANALRARSWLATAFTPSAMLNTPEDRSHRMAFQPNGPLLFTISKQRLRVWDWRHEQFLPWTEALGNVEDAAWSPDGRQIAVATSQDGTVRIHEPISGKSLKSLPCGEAIHVVRWHPDGHRLVTGGHRVTLWNVASAAIKENEWQHPEAVYGIGFNRGRTRIITACNDNQARLFAIDDPSLPAPLIAPLAHQPLAKAHYATPVFCKEDSRIVTLRDNGRLGVWDASTGALIETGWHDDGYLNRSLDVSSDGRWVAVGGGNYGLLANVDGRSFRLEHFNHLHQAIVSPDGQSILTTGYEGIARVWSLGDIETDSVVSPTTIPQQSTFALATYSSDGNAMAIASNRQVVIWERKADSGFVAALNWPYLNWKPRASLDGQWVTQGALHNYYANIEPRGNRLTVARVIDGKPAGPDIRLDGLLVDSCISPDSRSVSAVTVENGKGVFRIYDVLTGEPQSEPSQLPDLPLSVCTRPGDTKHTAIWCRNGSLQIYEGVEGRLVHKELLPGADGGGTHSQTAYSPDGSSLVTVSSTSLVFVHDASSFKLKYPPIQPVLEEGPCRSIAISPDSRYLATAVNGKNRVQVWDLETGNSVGPAMSHPGDSFGLWSVAFSSDGRWIATAHKDGRARIWDWRRGEIVGASMQHADEVNDAQFTPDGRYLLTCMRQGTLHVWDLATRKLAIPTQRDLVPKGGSTKCVCIAGERVVVSGENIYSILDLPTLLQAPNESLSSILARTELATNQQLQFGELVPFESHQWNDRWSEYVATRQTREAAAAELAAELDQATTEAMQGAIVSRAFRYSLHPELLRLRPDHPNLNLMVALELSNAGRFEELKQTLPKVLSQVPVYAKELPLTEFQLRTLAELQLGTLPDTEWQVLVPVSMTAESQCTFSELADHSILTGPAETPQGDSYTIRLRVPEGRIGSIRLETLSHPSLPNQGHGWGIDGNFSLTELRIERRREDGGQTPIGIRSCTSDYLRSLDVDTSMMDGPWSVLDGVHSNRWDIWNEMQTAAPHWLELDLEDVQEFNDSDEIVVHLDFRLAIRPNARLGRFRLLSSEEPKSCQKEVLRDVVRSAACSPWEAMAALELLLGNPRKAMEWLDQDMIDSSSIHRDLIQKSLLALATHQIGEHESAAATLAPIYANPQILGSSRLLQNLLLQVASEVSGKPMSDVLNLFDETEMELARLSQMVSMQAQSASSFVARALFLARLMRWDASAADFSEARKLEPTNRIHWQNEATSHLLGGNFDAYREMCREMIEKLGTSNDPQVIGTLCKTCLLCPGIVDPNDLPVQKLLDVVKENSAPTYRVFSIPNCALIALRQGKWEESISWAEQAPTLKGFIGAQVFLTRAMAEFQLGRHEAAMEWLARGESLVPEELGSCSAASSMGSNPLPADRTYRDHLVNEILRREASLMIRKTTQRDDDSDTNTGLELKQLTEEVKANPGLSTAHYRRGQYLARLGRWQDAAIEQERATELEPNYRLHWFTLVSYQLLAGDDAGYQKTCRQMLAHFRRPEDTEIADSMCKTCLLLPGVVPVHLLPATVVREATTTEKTKAVHFDWFVGCCALVSYRERDFHGAIAMADRHPGGSSQSAALALVVKSMAQARLGQRDEASNTLKIVESMMPADLRNSQKHNRVGGLLLEYESVSPDWLIVELLFREASQLQTVENPQADPLGTWSERCRQLVHENRVDEALILIEEWIAIEPTAVESHYWLGVCRLQKEDLSAAAKALEFALEMNSNHTDSLFTLCLVLIRSSRIQEASLLAERLVELEPKSSVVRRTLGLSYILQGLPFDALIQLEKCLTLDPQDGAAKRLLNDARLMKQDARDLELMLEGSLKPRDEEHVQRLAELCYYQQRYLIAFQLFSDTLSSASFAKEDPRNGFRYNAACTAIRISMGQGDAVKLDEAERARYRHQAYVWLRDELSTYLRKLEGATTETERNELLAGLRQWKFDVDLESVRSREQLAILTLEDREAWNELWDRLDGAISGVSP